MSDSILDQLNDELNKEDNTKDQIKDSLGSAVGSNNESKSLKAKFTQLLYSNRLIKSEQDAKKEVIKLLKADHGIPINVAKKVERLLEKGSTTEFEEEMSAVEQLYAKVRS